MSDGPPQATADHRGTGAGGDSGGVLPKLTIPRAVLKRAGLFSLIILLPIGLGAVLSGADAGLGLAMGVLGSIGPALKVPWRYAALLTVPIALTGVVALGVAGEPTSAAAFAALSCLLIVQGNLVVNGLLAAIPTIASVFTCMPGRPAGMIMVWMLVGGLIVVLALARVPRPKTRMPVPEATAWRHAVAMAALVALSVYWVNHSGFPHGYWVPMTITVVLRPFGAETMRRARQRVWGTLVGAVIAAALVLTLPPRIALLLAAALMVLMVAYALLGRYAEQVMCMTPFVVLMGAKGVADQALNLVAERAVITVGAVVVAALVSMGLTRYDQSHASRQTGVQPAAPPEMA